MVRIADGRDRDVDRRPGLVRPLPSPSRPSSALYEAAVTRLVGAILLEQNDGWEVQRRYTRLEALAPISDVPNVSPPVVAA
jgi:hypothetical protein